MSADLQPERPAEPDRLAAIDILRGIAVLMVMVTHLPFSRTGLGGSQLDPSGHTFPGDTVRHFTEYGAYGVHLFLVLSGFCIHLRWTRARDLGASIDFVAFWRRRLARLYPVYLLALAGTLLALFLLHGVLLGSTGSIAAAFGYESDAQFAIDIVVLLLLLQNLNGAGHRVGNGPFWSLALEEQLYALYFPMLWIRKRHGWTAVFVVTGVLSVAWRVAGVTFLAPVPSAWFILGPSFWWAWALGAWAVEAHHGVVPTPRWLLGPIPALASLLAVFACRPPVPGWTPLPGSEIFADLAFATLAFVAVVHVCARARGDAPWGFAGRVLHRIGLWSYSLYLVHDPVYKAAKQLAVEAGLPDAAVLLVRFGAGMLAGWLLYTLVERPTLAWARKLKVPVGRSAAAAPAVDRVAA